MNRFSKRVALPVLLVAGALLASGCGKSRPKEVTLSDAAVVGSWIEVPREVKASARRARASAPQEFLRYVTLNPDKTFVFTLRTLDGAPTKDDKKAEGTWKINTDLNVVEFTIDKNQFKSSETGYDWVPETMSELGRQEVPDHGMSDVIYAYDQTGSSAKLVHEK